MNSNSHDAHAPTGNDLPAVPAIRLRTHGDAHRRASSFMAHETATGRELRVPDIATHGDAAHGAWVYRLDGHPEVRLSPPDGSTIWNSGDGYRHAPYGAMVECRGTDGSWGNRCVLLYESAEYSIVAYHESVPLPATPQGGMEVGVLLSVAVSSADIRVSQSEQFPVYAVVTDESHGLYGVTGEAYLFNHDCPLAANDPKKKAYFLRSDNPDALIDERTPTLYFAQFTPVGSLR